MYKFLVTFGNLNMRPVVFDDMETAKASWRLTYVAGDVRFVDKSDNHCEVYEEAGEENLVGEIRKIEHHTSVTHL